MFVGALGGVIVRLFHHEVQKMFCVFGSVGLAMVVVAVFAQVRFRVFDVGLPEK